MADKPIIFSAPMVRALLDGRKSMTRRVLKPQPAMSRIVPCDDRPGWFGDEEGEDNFFAGYAPGDRLWVKETWTHTGTGVWATQDTLRAVNGRVEYRASNDIPGAGWFPSIFMFRQFSRLTLIVTDVRVQRLQDIGNYDAIAEGIQPHGHAFTGYGRQADVWMSPYDSFASLWNSLHGPDAWDANPWVRAPTFTVHKCNIDQMPEAA